MFETQAQKAANEIVAYLMQHMQQLNAFDKKEEDIKSDSLMSPQQQDKELLRLEIEREDESKRNDELMARLIDAAIADEEARCAAQKASAKQLQRTFHQSQAHQLAVANAMKKIETLGEQMTVEQLQSIVDQFLEDRDYETIGILQTMARKHKVPIDPIYGRKVNFGEDPTATLKYLHNLRDLLQRVIMTKPSDRAVQIVFIEKSVDRFFNGGTGLFGEGGEE